ncbi:MAG TPA: hypothetical protein VHE57_00175 [Mycobacteriales bacterium]|nr:hypothetical protein [Mycobacteriales bacterium]
MNSSKRTFALGAGVTAIAATVATPLLAGTAAASAHTLSLQMHNVSQRTVDNKPSGFSAGDEQVQVTRLTEAGKKVGWETGDCLTTRVAKTAEQICRFVFHLHDGEIVSTGAMKSGRRGPGTFALAITGGTGSYAAASGEVSITAVGHGPVPVTISASY